MPRLRVASLPAAALLLASACGDPDTSGTTGGTGGSTGGTTSASTGGAGGQTTSGGGGATGGVGGQTTTGGGGATGGAGGQTLCGNGAIDPGEACEGQNLQGQTCAGLGFSGGTLACGADCQLDLGDCTGSDSCYDGLDNDGDGKTDCEEADCAAICQNACLEPLVLADPDDPPGSTTGRAANLTPSCSGPSGPEEVFQITAVQTGMLDVTLIETSGGPFALAVTEACGSVAAELDCTATDVAGASGQKFLSVPILAGQTVFITVDSLGAAAEGTFQLIAGSRPLFCGDGAQDPPETCDDGNLDPGDGCSPTCAVESTETEPNGTFAAANAFATPWYGAVSPAGDVDRVQLDWPQAGGMAVETRGIGFGHCTDGSMDTVVSVFDAAHVLVATNDDHGGACSLAVVPNAPAGTYFVEVAAPNGAPIAAAEFPYSLAITPFQCGNGAVQTGEQCDDGNTAPGDGCDAACKVEVAESEPNDTTATADDWVSPWVARIDPDNDVDVVRVAVPGPSSKLTVTTTDPTGGAGCAGAIDTYVEILDPGGAVIAQNDDANGGYCSIASAANLAAGFYLVRVQAPPLLDASNVYIYSYKLNLKVE